MTTFLEALRIYEEAGFRIRTGLNPVHFANRLDVMFTALYRERQESPGVGLALQEVYFLECLFTHLQPKNMMIIGNGFGWSTIVLALLNRSGRVLAIDAAEDKRAERGLKLTNFLATREGLDARAVKGTSPTDVAAFATRHLSGPVDFALIDGEHTEAQQRLDFEAVREIATPDCLYVFHDVINYDMAQGFRGIVAASDLQGRVLERTPSGLAVLYGASLPEGARRVIAAFAEDPAVVADLRERIAAGESGPI